MTGFVHMGHILAPMEKMLLAIKRRKDMTKQSLASKAPYFLILSFTTGSVISL